MAAAKKPATKGKVVNKTATQIANIQNTLKKMSEAKPNMNVQTTETVFVQQAPAVKPPPPTDAQIDKMVKDNFQTLKRGERVNMYLQQQGEKPADVSVFVNGVPYMIKEGVVVNVPKPVYEILNMERKRAFLV